MKSTLNLLFIFLLHCGYAQVTLDADGPGNTYELITSVLAPENDPIEVPDCNHTEFGRHIDELFDNELNTNVFRFFIHVSPDNDRCKNFDRQRNEIKTYDKSPDNLLGVENEKVVYKWKFKLALGFQSSPNFTHLHQLKSVGGALESMPMYTLTARKGSPDQLELRYAETDKQITLTETDLTPLIGSWLDVTETISYGQSGSYEIEIKRVGDGQVLFSYSNAAIKNWRSGADFVRPKWGIYRSLNNAQDLRDEAVLFANFSIEELNTLSVDESELEPTSFTIFPNPIENTLHLKKLPERTDSIKIFSLDGKKIFELDIDLETELDLDVSSFQKGTYIFNISGKQLNLSKLICIL